MARIYRSSSHLTSLMIFTSEVFLWIVLESWASGELRVGSSHDGKQGNQDEIVPNPDDAVAVKAAWESFKKQRSKSYENANVEYGAYRNFKDNVRVVSDHNRLFAAGKASYAMRIHEYSDWSLCDIKKHLHGLTEAPQILDALRLPAAVVFGVRPYVDPSQEIVGEARVRRQSAMESLDYQTYGYVTPVKKQGKCGCSWSVAAAGALEGQYFGFFGKLVNVSIQNLIDCAGPSKNHGCNGGWPMSAFDYARRAGGIMAESEYPYNGKDSQPCSFNKANAIPRLAVAGGKYLPTGNEAAFREAVYNVGPVAAAISASSSGFINYSRGVYVDDSCSQKVDHAVLIVGYGTENGLDYWLVKNSWGTDWGLNGYIKMARNNKNQCAIASFGQYPIIMEP